MMKNNYIYLSLAALMGLIIIPSDLLYGQSCDQMISYWRMEEKSGDTYADIVGGHDAVATISAPFRDAGRVGKAQSFNGTSDFLTIPDHSDFDWSGDQSFTIEMWVRLKNISSEYNMVFIGRDAYTGPIHWWVGAERNTGRVVFNLIGSDATTNMSHGPNLVVGTWYHLVAIRDATHDVNMLYVNNSVVDTDTVDYSAGGFETDATIDIGVLNYNGLTDRFFAPAIIDEVAIYNVALSGSDIDKHYSNGSLGIGYCEDESPYFLSVPDSLAVLGDQFIYEAYATGIPTLSYSLEDGPGSIDPISGIYTWTPEDLSQSASLVTISVSNSLGKATQSFRVYVAEEPECPTGLLSLYKLNETSEPSYTDFAGGNTGVALNPPTPVSGKFAGAQQFDGENDGINIPDNGMLNFPAGSSFTLEFWVKTNVSSGNMVCIGRQGTIQDQDTSNLHLWVGVQKNTGEAVFYLRDSMGNEPEPNGQIMGGSIGDNNWHYVVAVRDGTAMKNYLYVDGNRVAVSEEYEYQSSFGALTGDPFNIGFLYRQNKNPDYFFDGVLDEVAIYTRALSIAEIASNYQQSFLASWHCESDNYAPGFITEPVTETVENEEYVYDIRATDLDSGDALSMWVSTKPAWLTFTDLGSGSGSLTGTPGKDDIGSHPVVITVTDAKIQINQEFSVEVIGRENNSPMITSEPVTSVVAGELYTYTLTAEDPDEDSLTMFAVSIPEFLQFDTITGILEGTPEEEHVGEHPVELRVSDGMAEVPLSFTLTVESSGVGTEDSDGRIIRIYPVPADQYLMLELDMVENGAISVIDITGKHLIEREIRAGENRVRLDLSGLEGGLYMFRLQSGEMVSVYSFTISR